MYFGRSAASVVTREWKYETKYTCIYAAKLNIYIHDLK